MTKLIRRVGEMAQVTNNRSSEQLSLFIAEDKDLTPKNIQDIMAYPYFSLAKRKRVTPIRFESTDIKIEVEGLERVGIANIYDGDFLIWAATQIRRQHQRTGEAPRTVFFTPKQVLKHLGKKVGGENYKQLENALERLKTTYIRTTVRSEHLEKRGGFSWLDDWTTHEDRKTGEPLMWTMTLSNWLYQGILQDDNILSLNPAYYLLSGGLEKRLYQIARKHAGVQAWGWALPMEALYAKTGSDEELRFFAHKIRSYSREPQPILEYALNVYRDEKTNVESVRFTPRDQLPKRHPLYQEASKELLIRRAAQGF
jgi:plasmid replication initiation protein